MDELSVNRRLAFWPGLPTLVNPKPLSRITPDRVFDMLGEIRRQRAHVAIFVAGSLDRYRRPDEQLILLFFFTPGREYRDDRRVGAQRKFGHDEIGGRRHSEEIDEDRFRVEGV